MTTADSDHSSAAEASREDAARARGEFSREADSAKEEGHKAVASAGEEASRLVKAAKHRAAEALDDQKETVADSMDDFAAAIRKASDELGGRDQSMAAGMVREVAQGLEQVSRSIHGKNIQDLTRSVASFARRQPTAFLLGATLAGVALGRFVRSSGEHLQGDASTGSRGFDDQADRRRTATSSSDRATTEVHGSVPGAVPSTGYTTVAGGIDGD